MAVCLDYQPLSYRKGWVISPRVQLVFALILAATLGMKVWLSVAVTQLGYRIAEVRQSRIELDMSRQELELQLSFLLRPDRLAESAERTLGLMPLRPAQARRLSYGAPHAG